MKVQDKINKESLDNSLSLSVLFLRVFMGHGLPSRKSESLQNFKSLVIKTNQEKNFDELAKLDQYILYTKNYK